MSMSVPSRRRNPTITPGKKGERKRNKRQELKKDNASPINGLAAISEKAEQDRKARLINNGITDADISLLSEPSNIFNTETDKIRNITTKNDKNLINIKATNFEFGIELKATITDRSRVIKGKKPKIFNRMPIELRKKKEEIKQASRQIDVNIIEKTRKRRELEEKNAAIAHENKLLDIKKKEAARLAQVELEKKMQIEAEFDELDWEEEIQVEEETESVIDEIEEEEVRIEEAFDDLDWEEEIQVEEEKEPVIDEIEEEFDELDWEEEIVPTIESGEVILAELRIAMRTEPSPINYIINMLTNKHDLSIQNAKYIINHIVSPISICKMLTDEQFDDFIQSLDKNNSDISKGGEIWTQVIQIIGLSSLTMDARVDIYNILSDGKNQNKISKRVITIALLLNALPINFKHWWSMDIFSLEVIEHYGKANKFFRNKKFPQEAIEEARMLICSYAIEKPKSISAEYNYAKQISGNEHENKTEKWLKGSLKDVRYITEKQIQTYRDKHYGNKYINQKITPDILLEIPIQLSAHSQPIHWIDAKNHFVDPALSSDENVQSICHQMNKYVRAYGPGLIVWGRNFSEEWNDATKGAVQHIKV
jgi:hypothetical protein